MYNSVTDPDLQISSGGGGGGRSQNHFFTAPPSPASTTVTCKSINGIPHEVFGISLQKDMPFT